MQAPLELWAGMECTINRVGDQYFDQMGRNSHARESKVLAQIAQLGIKTLRYPVLWEKIAPDNLENLDLSWVSSSLHRLKVLGVQPIIGLLHHGSGPRYTSLIDPDFPQKLAQYAGAVARRYPWEDLYTPINEPLTTARFSGLYGHWYPHGRDDLTFIKCLLNECKGIILAMREIRKVNPKAKLVQTEDLGKVYSTPLLKYQADMENERRWLSFDLLCGYLRPDMPMWDFMVHRGAKQSELQWFIDNPCPPDIIGINHYLTSDRYLDEKVESYPTVLHGGNGRHVYADEAAIRVSLDNYGGIRSHLEDAWNRYSLPLAITEAHLGCTREEQLRWLKDIWQTAERLREDNVPILAVTAWSLLGSFDWNCLVTKDNGYYEPGVFDARGNTLRPTALACMVKALAQQQEFHHPVIDLPGWWHRSDRFLYPERIPTASQVLNFHLPMQDCAQTGICNTTTIRPIIIIGANGTLGKAFAHMCDIRGIPYYLLSRKELNICQQEKVEETLKHLNPWAVINAAGYVRVDDAEREHDLCWQDNVIGPSNLANVCESLNIQLVTFSSDLVFCGTHKRPYLESDAIKPLNNYGLSKAEAEKRVLSALPSALVIRTSAFFSPCDDYNFVTIALRQLMAGERFQAARDLFVSPTYVPDLVNASLDLLIDGEKGLWHLSNYTEISWFELARMAARMKNVSTRLLEARAHEELPFLARRPVYSVLNTERCQVMPLLDDAMVRYIKEVNIPA